MFFFLMQVLLIMEKNVRVGFSFLHCRLSVGKTLNMAASFLCRSVSQCVSQCVKLLVSTFCAWFIPV